MLNHALISKLQIIYLLLEKFERAAAGTRSLKIFSRESSS